MHDIGPCRLKLWTVKHGFLIARIETEAIQTQSLALRKRKPQETQLICTQQTQAPANRNARSKQWQPCMIGCLPTQALAFLAVFVYATHAMQTIAFEWLRSVSIRAMREGARRLHLGNPKSCNQQERV